jgi:prevent-host-death family protein
MERAKPTVKVVNATEAKNRFGEMIKRAYMNEEHLIVKRDGIPVVAIVPMADYERLITLEDLPADAASDVALGSRQQMARRRFVQYLDAAHKRTPAVSEEEAEGDIRDAVSAVRARQ